MSASSRPLRVLLIGAYGFIGAHVLTALQAAGHTVVAGVRGGQHDPRFPHIEARAFDLAQDTSPEAWRLRLVDIDAVVNAAGILRETPTASFETVHHDALWALGQACEELGIRQLIQISALGQPADGPFIASKHRGDAALLALDLPVCILRPGLVYSTEGSYGGTSLLRALAALPGILAIPAGTERPCIQPIAVQDVAQAVVAALVQPEPARGILELVGPDPMGLVTYLQAWRDWLGFPAARVWRVPRFLVRLACALGERWGNGPLGQTMATMLDRGNLGSPEASPTLTARLGVIPAHLADHLARHPSHVQDRWHARLYLLLPALRATLIVVWLASALVGWLTPADTIAHLAGDGPLSPAFALVLARVTATADLAVGLLALSRRHRRVAWALMAAMTAGYTLGMGLVWPALWAEPLGGLWKNLPLLAALGIAWATEDRR